MIRFGGGGDGEGKNPPNGAVLSYFIADEHDDSLSIEITDAEGDLVRSYSSGEGDFERCIIGNMDQRLPFTVRYPTTKQGLNQWTWDMRRNGLHCVDDVKLFAGFGGASVIPGSYHVRISIGDAESSADLTLLPDPRNDATPADYAFLDRKLQEVTDLLNELLDRLQAVRKARSQIEALLQDHGDDADIRAVGESAIKRLSDWENLVTQVNYGTYEDEDAMPPMLDVHIRHVLDVMDEAGAPVSEGSLQRLEDLKVQWREQTMELEAINASDIATVNAWAQNSGVPHVSPPGGR
jgi:hypothetical protein